MIYDIICSMNATWNDFVKVSQTPVYAIGGAIAGGALGWFYDKLRGKKNRNTLARVLWGSAIGGGLGLVAGLLLRQKVIENRILPNNAKKDMDDLRGLWSFQRNYAYHNKRFADSIDEMGDGTGIGKNGFVLDSRIWDARSGNDKFNPDAVVFGNKDKRGASRFTMFSPVDDSGGKAKFQSVLMSTPARPSSNGSSLIALAGPVDLSNVFSFDREWPVYQLKGDQKAVDMLKGLSSLTMDQIREKLDSGDLSELVTKKFNNLYYPEE